MAKLLEESGKDIAYYENIEGGHGGAANNSQQAFMRTLASEFLWRQLTGDAPVVAPEAPPTRWSPSSRRWPTSQDGGLRALQAC